MLVFKLRVPVADDEGNRITALRLRRLTAAEYPVADEWTKSDSIRFLAKASGLPEHVIVAIDRDDPPTPLNVGAVARALAAMGRRYYRGPFRPDDDQPPRRQRRVRWC